MSFSQIPWENRVFRIDRECYLLFLGIDELDDKPFVRIGNSSWLNEKVLEVISHTVITESFTGNPFGEVGLTHNYRGLYLGEPKIVEVIKSFFDRFHVTDSEVISYREQEEREGRDHVYFYNTGNIVVTFGGQRLFDLYAREKADRHYNYYCSEILTILRKNPLKWEKGSIREKGFFRTGEDLYFFDGGKLLGLKWDRNYFKKLARSGWNPDRLEGILVNLKPDEMEGDKSAGVMNFIKRGIAARNPMTFFSRDESFSGKIEPLFEYVQSRDVPIHFKDISSRGLFEWNGTSGEWSGDRFTFRLEEKVNAKINEAGEAFLDFDGIERDCTLPDGVPVRIYGVSPDWVKLKELYVDSAAQVILKSDMKPDEIRLVREAAQTVQSLFGGWETGAAQLTPPQEKSLSEMKRLVRAVGRESDERVVLFACNCVALLSLLSREDTPLAGKAEEAASVLGKRFDRPERQAVDFLFSANCYREGCFYLPYKLDISPGDRQKASDMHEALLQCDKKEVDFFFSERERLEAILAALREGTLWEEMKKHEESAAEGEATLVAPPSPSGSSAPSGRASGSDSPGKGGAKAPPARGSSSSGGKGRWLPALLLLLLLLGGFGYLGFDYATRADRSLVSRIFPSAGNSAEGAAAAGEGEAGAGGSGPEGGGESAVSGSGQSGTAGGGGNGENAAGSEGAGRVLTGREEVPDSSPLSGSDTQVIPAGNGSDAPEVQFVDSEETIVTKPFVMDDNFLEDFTVGGIRITMADIHLKANAISVMNGYRDLGFHIVEGADPTIIEPGLVLRIPGNLTYKVKPDDNIWYIAARLLESELAEHTKRFEELKNEYAGADSQGRDVSPIVKEMNGLIENSNCENFRKEVQSWLNKG